MRKTLFTSFTSHWQDNKEFDISFLGSYQIRVDKNSSHVWLNDGKNHF